jgi:hypothetical protein
MTNTELTYLMSVPLAGPASSGRLLAFPHPDDFVYAISRDSSRTDLISAPIGGGTLVKLNGAERVGGILLAGPNRFLYSADVGLKKALVSVDGPGSSFELTASLAGLSLSRGLTADGTRALWVTLPSSGGWPVELYSGRL